MPITFTSRQEALEYMQVKHGEGYISKLEHVGRDKYIVTIVSTVARHEDAGMGLYQNGKITLKPHASTRTRLHELGHKVHKHKSGMMKLSQLARDEIEAESYAYEKMDKPVNYKVGIPALASLVEDFGETPEEALEVVIQELGKKGIHTTEEERQKLMSLMG